MSTETWGWIIVSPFLLAIGGWLMFSHEGREFLAAIVLLGLLYLGLYLLGAFR